MIPTNGLRGSFSPSPFGEASTNPPPKSSSISEKGRPPLCILWTEHLSSNLPSNTHQPSCHLFDADTNIRRLLNQRLHFPSIVIPPPTLPFHSFLKEKRKGVEMFTTGSDVTLSRCTNHIGQTDELSRPHSGSLNSFQFSLLFTSKSSASSAVYHWSCSQGTTKAPTMRTPIMAQLFASLASVVSSEGTSNLRPEVERGVTPTSSSSARKREEVSKFRPSLPSVRTD
mmetsp:Transcript_48501/g.95684  ORF Transcript_48501/g.95684 Transcript_48501/m.95684 type:complete len:227 (-) Transcript_48501:338-1018(-)